MQRAKSALSVSAIDLAEIFNVGVRMVSDYVKAGMPAPIRTKYALIPCVRWWLARKQAELDKQLDGLDWKQQEVRLKRARAEREEHELRVLRGEYWKASDIMEQHGRLYSAFRARVLAIGSNLAPRVLSCKTIPEAKEMIDKETWEALNELSRAAEIRPGDVPDSDSAPKADRKRVGRSKPSPKSRVERKSGVVAD